MHFFRNLGFWVQGFRGVVWVILHRSKSAVCTPPIARSCYDRILVLLGGRVYPCEFGASCSRRGIMGVGLGLALKGDPIFEPYSRSPKDTLQGLRF